MELDLAELRPRHAARQRDDAGARTRAAPRPDAQPRRWTSASATWVADERKFKQIVVNLLSNAVKFTPAGGSVTVRAHRVGPDAEAAVEVAVVDTGVGIAPEDQQALVFEEFRQVGAQLPAQAEGTGLGLSLARRFVELHGGTHDGRQRPGQGSTFAFTLPERALEAA